MCMAQKEGNMGIVTPISTKTLEKTGTIIRKGLDSRNKLVKAVEYGPNTRMVNDYGISSIITSTPMGFKPLGGDLGKRLDIILENGQKVTFHTDHAFSLPTEFKGSGPAKERFQQLLNGLKLFKNG